MNISGANIEVNGNCNYKCKICPQSSGREKSFLKKMPLSLFEKNIIELKQYGLKYVTLNGSGEATLNSNLSEYVYICSKYNIESYIITNGFLLKDKMIDSLLDSGINYIRFSILGYDRDTYKETMKIDAFDRVIQNLENVLEKSKFTKTKIQSYHLVYNKNLKFQINQYRENIIDKYNLESEIWMMYNWSGQIQSDVDRTKNKKIGCNRMFLPIANIRAGGIDGKQGAVVPCCYVLGKDSKGVFGHTQDQSVYEILNSENFKEFQKKHKKFETDDIDLCKDCDMLYSSPETLVWSNFKEYGQIKDRDINVY